MVIPMHFHGLKSLSLTASLDTTAVPGILTNSTDDPIASNNRQDYSFKPHEDTPDPITLVYDGTAGLGSRLTGSDLPSSFYYDDTPLSSRRGARRGRAGVPREGPGRAQVHLPCPRRDDARPQGQARVHPEARDEDGIDGLTAGGLLPCLRAGAARTGRRKFGTDPNSLDCLRPARQGFALGGAPGIMFPSCALN